LPNPASSFAAGVKISEPVRVVAVPWEFAEIEIDAGRLAAVGRIKVICVELSGAGS